MAQKSWLLKIEMAVIDFDGRKYRVIFVRCGENSRQRSTNGYG